jgi:hypothetical protein
MKKHFFREDISIIVKIPRKSCPDCTDLSFHELGQRLHRTHGAHGDLRSIVLMQAGVTIVSIQSPNFGDISQKKKNIS